MITHTGHQEAFRTDLSWLPDADRIVLHFRETEHGLKAMYDDGHLVEFAVFDLDELKVARLNDYNLLLDRANLEPQLAALVQKNVLEPATDVLKELLYVLSLLQVGAGRYARGEHISGHMFIKAYALQHLMPVLVTVMPSSNRAALDNLDAFRRFEIAYPELGARLADIQLLPPIVAAQSMVDLIQDVLADLMADYPQPAVDTVRRYVERLSNGG